jgi:hypothetical protein
MSLGLGGFVGNLETMVRRFLPLDLERGFKPLMNLLRVSKWEHTKTLCGFLRMGVLVKAD